MSGQGKRTNAAELENALALLDHELSSLRLGEPLQVRALGGYALMKHGIRDDAQLTTDIDTMTQDYQRSVTEAIERVAQRTGLAPDWLNNDVVALGEGAGEDTLAHAEAMIEANWLPQETSYINIDMAIADIPTLTRAKIAAVDDHEFNDRVQDKPDLFGLIDRQNITSLAQFDKAYPDEFGDHAVARAEVGKHLGHEVHLTQDTSMDEVDMLLAGIDPLDSRSNEFSSMYAQDDPYGSDLGALDDYERDGGDTGFGY